MSVEALQSTQDQWPAKGYSNAGRYGQARQQLHNAVQWLARIALSYGSENSGDARVALEWNRHRNAFVSHSIGMNQALELQMPVLEFTFLENGLPVPHTMQIDDNSPAKVEAWLLVELLHRGFDRDKFSKRLPYDMAGLMTGDADVYSAEPYLAELQELSEMYELAEQVFARFDGLTGSRCWPHNLHMTRDVELAGDPGTRVGFSPGDDKYPEPYFYAGATPSGLFKTSAPVIRVDAGTFLPSASPEEVCGVLKEGISSAPRLTIAGA